MIRSTLGFIYTPNLDKVLLIEKQKPAHHKGLLNGLGGKCEKNESYRTCLTREVLEESGLVIPSKAWRRVGVMSWDEWHVEIFAAVYYENTYDAHTLTIDSVSWYSVKQLPKNCISNLAWLIPLGADCLSNAEPPIVKIKYQE